MNSPIMKKPLVIGNRFCVLQAMLENGIHPAKILAVKGSYLEKELDKISHPFVKLESKSQLMEVIHETDFDFLISNGCPYIIPVKDIKKDHQTFINIHPSFLPDLKGIHPVNGAILFGKSAGATCHIMDDDIDSGPIISQVKIPVTEDMDLGLLYQLSFMAERDAFLEALDKKFMPGNRHGSVSADLVYYTRKDGDLVISFHEEVHALMRRIKAFGIASQGTHFIFNGSKFRVLDAQIVTNPYLMSKIENYKECEIVFIYDDTIVLKKQHTFLKLKGLSGDLSKLQNGQILT